MAGFDLEPGATLPRKQLHDVWGHGRYGGMEPAVKAESVFLFTNPKTGGRFGYRYDGWHGDERSTTPVMAGLVISHSGAAATRRW